LQVKGGFNPRVFTVQYFLIYWNQTKTYIMEMLNLLGQLYIRWTI
jgi:hypothetical protein